MALGADRRRILGLVLRGALLQLAAGLAIGIPAALAGGRLLANQLYGVKSYDPAILALAAVVLMACALVVGFVPAQRAASIDPIRALRGEGDNCRMELARTAVVVIDVQNGLLEGAWAAFASRRRQGLWTPP